MMLPLRASCAPPWKWKYSTFLWKWSGMYNTEHSSIPSTSTVSKKQKSSYGHHHCGMNFPFLDWTMSWKLIYLATVLTCLLTSCHLCPPGEVKPDPHARAFATPAFLTASLSKPHGFSAPISTCLYKVSWVSGDLHSGPAWPLAVSRL